MDKDLHQALQAAFNVCLEVRDFTGNVIASDGKHNASKSDLTLNQDAKKYIRWYKKTFKNALGASGQTGT